MKNIQNIVDKHYDEMFHELCEKHDEDLYDIVIEVKLANPGLTVRRSWQERDQMLIEEAKKNEN